MKFGSIVLTVIQVIAKGGTIPVISGSMGEAIHLVTFPPHEYDMKS